MGGRDWIANPGLDAYADAGTVAFYRAPSVIEAARALRFRLWLGRHYYGKGQ
jgi:hypothetical protein